MTSEKRCPSAMDDLPAAIERLTDEFERATSDAERERLSTHIKEHFDLWFSGQSSRYTEALKTPVEPMTIEGCFEARDRAAAKQWRFDPIDIAKAVEDGKAFSEKFQKLVEDVAHESWRIEMLYGLRTVGYEEGDSPHTFKRVFEPVLGPQTSVSDSWDTIGLESAVKDAETALVSRGAMLPMEPDELRICWSKPDDPSHVPPLDFDFDAVARGELAISAETQRNWLEAPKEPVKDGVLTYEAIIGKLRDEDCEPIKRSPEHQNAFDEVCRRKFEAKRIGSIDICIKHRFRGTAEQPGCPECTVDDGFFFTLSQSAGTEIHISNEEAEQLLSQPVYATWTGVLKRDQPEADFSITIGNLDAATEPSAPPKRSDEPAPEARCACLAFTHPDGQAGTFRNGCRVHRFPPKRSDDPVPTWLSAEAPEATSKACGCFTASGVTLQCLACAKGGGR